MKEGLALKLPVYLKKKKVFTGHVPYHCRRSLPTVYCQRFIFICSERYSFFQPPSFYWRISMQFERKSPPKFGRNRRLALYWLHGSMLLGILNVCGTIIRTNSMKITVTSKSAKTSDIDLHFSTTCTSCYMPAWTERGIQFWSERT